MIYQMLAANNEYFRQKPDGLGRMGFHGKHKCVVAMRMLAYGSIADTLDDGYAMAESTVLECVKEFARTVIAVFEEEYLRPPKEAELKRILEENKARGFPGMIGSIDCMHWEWGSCPVGWHGQYIGRKGRPTVVLEAIATKDLRVWHAFFGMPGSCNDLNVLDRSPVFDDLANGRTQKVEFSVNNHNYDMGYYLADKIYPDWATFVKTKSEAISPKDKTFAEAQEAFDHLTQRLHRYGLTTAGLRTKHDYLRTLQELLHHDGAKLEQHYVINELGKLKQVTCARHLQLQREKQVIGHTE